MKLWGPPQDSSSVFPSRCSLHPNREKKFVFFLDPISRFLLCIYYASKLLYLGNARERSVSSSTCCTPITNWQGSSIYIPPHLLLCWFEDCVYNRISTVTISSFFPYPLEIVVAFTRIIRWSRPIRVKHRNGEIIPWTSKRFGIYEMSLVWSRKPHHRVLVGIYIYL